MKGFLGHFVSNQPKHSKTMQGQGNTSNGDTGRKMIKGAFDRVIYI